MVALLQTTEVLNQSRNIVLAQLANQHFIAGFDCLGIG
jgi:hypothetical protein